MVGMERFMKSLKTSFMREGLEAHLINVLATFVSSRIATSITSFISNRSETGQAKLVEGFDKSTLILAFAKHKSS